MQFKPPERIHSSSSCRPLNHFLPDFLVDLPLRVDEDFMFEVGPLLKAICSASNSSIALLVNENACTCSKAFIVLLSGITLREYLPTEALTWALARW